MPASENAFSTSFGVIDVPVTVSWYCVPPLNSTPMLKPRVAKLATLITMIDERRVVPPAPMADEVESGLAAIEAADNCT